MNRYETTEANLYNWLKKHDLKKSNPTWWKLTLYDTKLYQARFKLLTSNWSAHFLMIQTIDLKFLCGSYFMIHTKGKIQLKIKNFNNPNIPGLSLITAKYSKKSTKEIRSCFLLFPLILSFLRVWFSRKKTICGAFFKFLSSCHEVNIYNI